MGQKTTLSEFVADLANMNDGEDFASERLRELYEAVVTAPLQFEASEPFHLFCFCYLL